MGYANSTTIKRPTIKRRLSIDNSDRLTVRNVAAVHTD